VALDPSTFRPLKREEYDKLVELGMFEGERVELLRGMVVRMTPKGPAHDDVIERATHRFVTAVYPRAHVRVQAAFVTSDGSEPEPDLALVPPESHAKQHPSRAYLIIEVAQSSLATDRNAKALLYAESNVPEYWVVNLVDGVVEVSTEPRAGLYTKTAIFRRGAFITLNAFSDVTIAVDDLLPALERA
jgi:Uma2 family endonuclease